MAPGIPLPTLAQLERTYRFVDLSDFSTRTVIAEICNAPRGSAVIIGNANLFRSPDVPPRPEPARMPEDLWVPHLVTLMREAEVAAREIDGLVFHDIGVHLPTEDRKRVVSGKSVT